MTEALHEQLREAQDRDEDIQRVQQAVRHESVTGNEANLTPFLLQEMTKLGLAPKRGDFLPGRPNVWGAREGNGNGPRLMFVGHTDTVHVRGWEENWAGDVRENPFSAAIVDGAIWGRGVADLKGGICATLGALGLLDRAGIKLAGSVAYAFIGDEESGEPDTGVSAGARDLVRRVKAGEISKPDFAVYVEPTKLQVFTAQIGFFIADVAVTGKSAYFGTPEHGIDALKATHRILSAVWEHAQQLESLGEHDLAGRSSVLVTGLSGGGYIAVPGECKFSVIRKLRPGEDLDQAVADFEAALRAADVAEGITLGFSYPAGRDHPFGGSPVEIDPSHPTARQLSTAITETTPGKGGIGGAPYWSEVPFLINEIGCPAVYCAPGDISNCHTFEERLDIEEYLAAIRAFAVFIIRYCGIIAHY